MKPFLTTLCLCAAAAVSFGGWQHGQLQRLREENAGRISAARPVTAGKAIQPSPAASGIAVVNAAQKPSPGMARAILASMRRIETLSPEELKREIRRRINDMTLPGLMGREQTASLAFAASSLGRSDPAGTLAMLADSHGNHCEMAATIVWMDWLLRDRTAAATWLSEAGYWNRDGLKQAARMYAGPTMPELVETLQRQPAAR